MSSKKLGFLRYLISSERLDTLTFGCGCVAGVYLTYHRSLLTVIDDKALHCANLDHWTRRIVAERFPFQRHAESNQDWDIRTY